MRLKNKNIAVTGGAGFIGSHLVDELAARAGRVLVIDDFSIGKLENLKRHRKNKKVKIVKADIRNKARMISLLRGVDVLFHMATRCLRASLRNPELVNQVNVDGTLNLCIAGLKNKIKKFVYCSSSEIYGTAKTVPMDEDHPCVPTTIYGASKLTGELYVRAFYNMYKIPMVIVRPFNTYGPREHFEGERGEVIPKFVLRALNNLSPVIFGNGNQTRDFTFVTDSVKGIIQASINDKIVGKAINIAYGQEVSIKNIAGIVLNCLGKKKIKPEFGKTRPADVRRHFADIKLAKKTLCYKPEVDITKGITEYIDWFKTEYPDHKRYLKLEKTYNWKLLGGK